MTLKINFCDFWPGFENNNLFLIFLERYFSVSVSKNPDYLFYSVYGNDHFKYDNCIKILYTGENLVPDFNLCDYALGFHHITFGDRYLRFPLFVYYLWYYSDILKKEVSSIRSDEKTAEEMAEELLEREFCNFVYSNNINSDPLRDLFFHKLSEYKKIDSGGRHLNNIGKPVANKMAFIRDYKFTIAFENSSIPGYTTEKLLEPLLMKSMPVYYGNSIVHEDFNVDSFVQVKGINDFDRAIEEIIYLDKNDDLYIRKLNQSILTKDNSLEVWEKKLLDFMGNIFNQPHSLAGRKPEYGFNKFHIEELRIQAELMEKRKRINQIKAWINTFRKRILPV